MKIDDSLKSVLKNRQTIRKLACKPISQSYLDILIWAACGHTHTIKDVKMRTAPSAGARYPVEIYFVIQNSDGTDDGIYYYDFEKEGMTLMKSGKCMPDIKKVSFDQEFILNTNLAAIMTYNPDKIEPQYGPQSRKYAFLECGHIAQNLLLMATSLGMGAVPVGAFQEKGLREFLGIDSAKKEVLYMVCVGPID